MLKYILLIIVIFSSFMAKSQCSSTLLPVASEQLEDFIYIKEFQVKLKEVKEARDANQITIPIMLNKGTKYRFVIDDAKEYEGRLIFELHSDRGKRILSSYVEEVKKNYSVLEFVCNRSGMYFLNLEFQEYKEGCGLLVYGFKKQ